MTNTTKPICPICGRKSGNPIVIKSILSYYRSVGERQTSLKPTDNQLPFPNDGGGLKTRQDVVAEGDRPLPWETEGETDNRQTAGDTTARQRPKR